MSATGSTDRQEDIERRHEPRGNFVSFMFEEHVRLDGRFTSEGLREIADALENQ